MKSADRRTSASTSVAPRAGRRGQPSWDSVVAAAGFRWTPKRQVVMEVLRSTDGPLDADQITHLAQRAGLSINRSTVDRTLAALRKHGLFAVLGIPEPVKRRPHRPPIAGGFGSTPQRRAVMDVVRGAREPLATQDIHLLARQVVQRISLSTVTRIVAGLCRLGLIEPAGAHGGHQGGTSRPRRAFRYRWTARG